MNTFNQTSTLTKKTATKQDVQLDNAIRDIGSLWSSIREIPYDLYIAASDETTALAIASDVLTFEVQRAFTLSTLRLGLNVAGTTDGITEIDILKNGVSIFSTTATIDLGEKTTTTAATPWVLDENPTVFEVGDIISVSILGVSTGATEAGLKVYLLGNITY